MATYTSVDILKALADETRLGIVKRIAAEGGVMPSCDIVGSCESLAKISQPTLSHHFAKLVDAGVLRLHKQGTQNLYEVDGDVLEAHGIDIIKL